jgi:hypothetical protein
MIEAPTLTPCRRADPHKADCLLAHRWLGFRLSRESYLAHRRNHRCPRTSIDVSSAPGRKESKRMYIGSTKHGKPITKSRRSRPVAPSGFAIPLHERVLPEPIKPLVRTLGYKRQVILPRLKAMRPVNAAEPTPMIFIIGCGRSGTTLLGNMIGAHPEVSYLLEPYGVWTAISPAMDVTQVFSRGERHCLLDANSVTPEARRKFQRLMSRPPGITLVEKTPHNTWRIGYLNALATHAKFVHIIRDGIDVARSIEKCAKGDYKLGFRQTANPWWGVGYAKWHTLASDGKKANYYPQEVDSLSTDVQRGAYEWLVSQLEVQAWRERLGASLVEITYQSLIVDPAGTVRSIAEAHGLSCPEAWLLKIGSWVNNSVSPHSEPLALPQQMCEDFNRLQASYGFDGRAIPT